MSPGDEPGKTTMTTDLRRAPMRKDSGTTTTTKRTASWRRIGRGPGASKSMTTISGETTAGGAPTASSFTRRRKSILTWTTIRQRFSLWRTT
jgi:hypothetical protein